ncbi:hypothetical protein Tco_0988130 [Tanacetum coccineum]|uniref:Retrovirus-related Pol polyprotein from transposon TNT 1-94-like beta-barrel domain-containing protein n=1 Tax=Tanacetum coccineum TaxID=301880 RepID=A0ABQ5EQ26_9ASTR
MEHLLRECSSFPSLPRCSDQAEEGPTNYVLIAYSSSSSDSEGNPQMDLQDKGVIVSGCSSHMTGNMSYLIDYEQIDGGYVAFGGNHKGEKITGKCTVKTGNLDFENVYFVQKSSGNARSKEFSSYGFKLQVIMEERFCYRSRIDSEWTDKRAARIC